MSEPAKCLVICLGLFAAAMLLYRSSVGCGFINYDDRRVLLDHPELYNRDSLVQSLRAIFVDCFPREEPLLVRDLSWALDARIFGFERAAGYHFVNVVLHGLVAALLCLFLRLLTGRMLFAGLTAAFFLALAVHVEPVVWIMGRKDLLAAVFVMLALVAQDRALSQAGAARGAWYGAAVLSFACGTLSKISVVTAPAVLFLHLALFRHLRGARRPDAPLDRRRLARLAVPLVIPYAVIGWLVYRWYQGVLAASGVLDRGYTAAPLQHAWTLLKVLPMVVLKYVGLVFAPARLSLFYAWPDHTSDFSTIMVAASLATAGALLGTGIYLWRRHKDLAFYYWSFFALMAPYFNIRYFGIWVANRYVYLAAFCLLALAVELALRLARRRPPWGAVVAGALLGVSAGWNLWAQAGHRHAWRSAEALWRYETGLPSTRIYAYDNLASLYYEEMRAAGDDAARRRALDKVAAVLDAAERRFHPRTDLPPGAELYYLYHMRALAAQAGGAPPGTQMQWLEAAAALNPRFAPTQWELALRFYRRALRADGAEREAYARRSRECFVNYRRHALKDPSVLRRIERMERGYASDFPFLGGGR